MSWNYRVMRHVGVCPISKEPTCYYAIHEVYYDGKGNVDGWSTGEIEPSSEDLGGLDWVLERMTQALNKPILDYDTGKEIATVS